MSDPTAPPEPATPAAPRIETAPANAKRRSGAGVFSMFVLMLIPLAAAGWVGWRQLELQNELAALRANNVAAEELKASSANQFADVQQRQQQLEERMQQIDARVEQASQQALAQVQQQLATSSAEVRQQAEQQVAQVQRELAAIERQVAAARLHASEREAGGSPLAEAEMLLRFAQQRLTLARDTATAIGLYIEADELLRMVDDPSVFPVRETLARELAALQATPAIDVPGLFARLSEVAARVENFAVVSEASVQDFSVPDSQQTAAPESPGWLERMQQTLGEYFVVSNSNEDILPQLSASDQYQLRALVQLQIEQAKLALLRADPQVYQQALDDAANTAQQWLRGEAGSLDDFVATLASLRDTPIVVELPAADEALAALRRLSGLSAPETLAPPLAENRP